MTSEEREQALIDKIGPEEYRRLRQELRDREAVMWESLKPDERVAVFNEWWQGQHLPPSLQPPRVWTLEEVNRTLSATVGARFDD